MIGYRLYKRNLITGIDYNLEAKIEILRYAVYYHPQFDNTANTIAKNLVRMYFHEYHCPHFMNKKGFCIQIREMNENRDGRLLATLEFEKVDIFEINFTEKVNLSPTGRAISDKSNTTRRTKIK